MSRGNDILDFEWVGIDKRKKRSNVARSKKSMLVVSDNRQSRQDPTSNVDSILEKIKKSGFDSLTENEKNILESFSNILVFDNNDNLIKLVSLIKGHRFNYKPLSTEQSRFSDIYVDDPWLQVLQMKAKAVKDTLTIIENIYYDYADFRILPSAENTLEKVVKVMQLDPNITIEISAHTDSRGSASENQKLSLKRAQSAVDYMVKRGIDKKRLTSVGYGETRLLNKCKDGAECSEDEHSKNRRTEFKINKK